MEEGSQLRSAKATKLAANIGESLKLLLRRCSLVTGTEHEIGSSRKDASAFRYTLAPFTGHTKAQGWDRRL